MGNLATLDLNLLKVLVEIERQRSVTAAAHSLGIGQPAVSQSLSRLREAFKDDLFVRGPGGMVPTDRLLELIGPFQAALGQIEETAYGDQTFDAATSDTQFVIGATDYVAAMVTPKILATFKKKAPDVTISLVRADQSDGESKLSSGDIDLFVGVMPKVGKWMQKRRLLSERHLCVFNPQFMSLPDQLSVEEYAACDHMLIVQRNDETDFIDEVLTGYGLKRKVLLATPYFLQSAYLLERSPVIATLPERFILGCSNLSKMEVRELPFELPKLDIQAVWRAGDERNPRQRYLRETLVSALKF